MVSKAKDIGKWFEDQCEPHLKTLCSRRGRMFYKFPDSRSARGTVTAQPGEFMLLLPFGAALIECKASKKYETFRSCMASMVRDSQYGWHKRWMLSNNPSMFIFYSDVLNCIELWDGRDILIARRNAKPLKKEGYILRLNLKDTPIAEAMEIVVNRFEDELLVAIGH